MVCQTQLTSKSWTSTSLYVIDLCARWLCKPIAGQVLSESGRRNLHQLLGDTLKTTGPSTPSYVPTRLVDVGGVDGENDPRLVISEKHWPPTGQTDGSGDRRYIALSYCWGSKEQAHLQLKTTSDSLHLRLQAIPLSTCPQTLYDAVMVCRALGVRYIWIDALCILQGDKSDWDKESATMANVYSNSILTIAAAQGDSCVSGFAERPVPSQINLPFKSTLKPSVSGRYSIFQSHRGDSLQNIDRDYGVPPLSDYFNPNPPPRDEFSFSTSKHNSFDADLDYSQWSTRAWTFQEASLSPRLLLFGKYMSHLLVDNYRISEDGTYLHGSGYTPWGKSIRTSYTNASHRDNEVHDDWRLLVKRYSERDLSYSEDKLPAISALAQHFAPYIGPGEYLAGLWSSDLHHGLLWAHFGMNTPQTLLARPASKYTTAPSWSWASQLEAIGWTWAIRVSITPEFEFLDAKVAIDGYNEYGRVKGGFLSLSTKICKLPSTCLHRTSVYIGMTFPYELHSTDGKYIAHLLFDWRHASVEAPKDPETGAEVEDGPTDLLSMVLISSRPYNDTELQDRDVYDPEILLGLLVLPTATPGEYTRAGLFFTEARHLGGRRFWDQVGTQTIRLV